MPKRRKKRLNNQIKTLLYANRVHTDENQIIHIVEENSRDHTTRIQQSFIKNTWQTHILETGKTAQKHSCSLFYE
jgi:LEA14-like dessication related protein